MKNIICAVLVLMTASMAEARPRKHWFTDPKWWAGEAVIAAAIAADAHSTSRGVGMGLQETNWALGPRPTNRRIALVSLGYFGIQTSLHAAAWHVTHHVPLADSCQDTYIQEGEKFYKRTRCTEFDQDKLGWRIFGYVGVPAAVAIINGHAAAKNYQLQRDLK